MAKTRKPDQLLRSTRPTQAARPRRAQVSHASTLDKGELSDQDLRGDESRIVAQTGGSRGSSNRANSGHEATRGSRTSVAGADELEQKPQDAGGTDDPIRGPLPPGATPEDYVGSDTKPHKTRETGGARNHASRKRNEVL